VKHIPVIVQLVEMPWRGEVELDDGAIVLVDRWTPTSARGTCIGTSSRR